MPRPFIDADGEVGSTSEAGDLDSMDSDKEGPPEFNSRSMAAGGCVTCFKIGSGCGYVAIEALFTQRFPALCALLGLYTKLSNRAVEPN